MNKETRPARRKRATTLSDKELIAELERRGLKPKPPRFYKIGGKIKEDLPHRVETYITEKRARWLAVEFVVYVTGYKWNARKQLSTTYSEFLTQIAKFEK